MVAPLIAAAFTLAEFAPVISRWFNKNSDGSGLTSEVSEKIVKIAQAVTGTDTPIDAAKKLGENTTYLLRYQQEVMRLDRDLETAYLKDRQSARERDMAFITSARYNTRADLMVVAAAVGLISCLGALIYYRTWLPGEAVGVISTIAGIFGSCLKDAYTFEFGSSRGSRTKDATVLMQSSKNR